MCGRTAGPALGYYSSSIRGYVEGAYLARTPVLTVSLDGQQIARRRVESSGNFELSIGLPTAVASGNHNVEVLSSSWYVPANFNRGTDNRPLSWRVKSIQLVP